MRKSIFFVVVLLATTVASAQITLLHTFDGQVNLRTIDYNQTSQYTSNYLNDNVYLSSPAYYDNSYQELFRIGRWYYGHMETNNYIITFWDDNFQPSGTKTIVFPTIENYYVDYFSASMDSYTTKFFNDDDEVEYLVKYRLTEEYMSGKNWTEYRDIEYKLVLIDKNGNILYDFGEAEYIYGYSALYYINSKWLFLLTKRHYDITTNTYPYQTEVYQINKQSPQGLSQISPAHLPAYPNPAMSEINIPTPNKQGVRIYDMNGRLVDSNNSNGEVVNVNVSGYPSGNYIYQAQGNSGVFIKQ